VFDDSRLDDPDALAEVDDSLRAIATWGAQVRSAGDAAADALAAVVAGLPTRPRAVLAAGPDGRLLRTVLERVCPVPFVAWPHAGLPGWAGPLDLVVVLAPEPAAPPELESTVAEAGRRGCELLVVAPEQSRLSGLTAGKGALVPAGSRDPLAVSVPVLAALHDLALGPDVAVEPVATALDEIAERCGPAQPIGENPAKEVALVLADRVPVVWGGSPLSGRAARRWAEALRAATGVPAVAGSGGQLAPLLRAAPEHDVFADPFDEGADLTPTPMPVLVVLDDGEADPTATEVARELRDIADARGVHVHRVIAQDGHDVARFASLLAIGRFAAVYLAVGQSAPGTP
jgi:hypothetical protein